MHHDQAAARRAGSPEVTVVIPTKDRWALLQRSLPSVLAQVGVAIEVIVVDDGSADGTAGRLEHIREPRVRVLRQEVSEGVASARNRGVAHASAEWTAFLDDDDVWAPHKLRTQLDRAAEGAEFVYSGMVVLDQDGDRMQIEPQDPEALRRSLFHHNFVGAPSTVMVRTDLVRRAGGFDERLSALADWDLWLRLIVDHGATAAACAEPLVAYALHDENMHRTATDSILGEFHYLVDKHSDGRRTFGGTTFFRWVATSYRRAGRRGAAARTYAEAAMRYRSAGDLARAIGVLLGEPIMAIGRRQPPRAVAVQLPAWVPPDMIV